MTPNELPPLDVTQEERSKIENMRPMAPRNTLIALERLACRERQLLAALERAEKEAAVADLATKELREARAAITDWESREAAVTSEEETFEQVIAGLRDLEPFWSKAFNDERVAHEITKAELAALRGETKGSK